MANKATKRALAVTPKPVTAPKHIGRKPTAGAFHMGTTAPTWAKEHPDREGGQLTLWLGDDDFTVGIDRYEYIYLKRMLAKLRGIEFTAESEVMDQALPGETVVDVDETEVADAV